MAQNININDNGKKRKATAEELEQFEKDRLEALEREGLIEAEQTAKAQAKASAMAKLSALGLTEEEVIAVIGI